MYFYEKGKGRYKAAPRRRLEGGARGRRAQAPAGRAAASATWRSCLNGRLPAEFEPLLARLLYKPDRNRIESKALEDACARAQAHACATVRALRRAALDARLPSRPLSVRAFPATAPAFRTCRLPPLPDDLPLADVAAFSIDDATTTEIDDAFSVADARATATCASASTSPRPRSASRPVPRSTRSRASGCPPSYFPGGQDHDAAAGRRSSATRSRRAGACPALSLYLELACRDARRVAANPARVERCRIAANLRHDALERVFNERASRPARWIEHAVRRASCSSCLHRLAAVLEAGRGDEPSDQSSRGRVQLPRRRRSRARSSSASAASPIDKLVSELMILVNSELGQAARRARGAAAIYRVAGSPTARCSMSTVPPSTRGWASRTTRGRARRCGAMSIS